MSCNAWFIYEYKKEIFGFRGFLLPFFPQEKKAKQNNKDSGEVDDFMHAGYSSRSATI